ncbi:penicillin acylase family protein [Colwellia sp. Arc7-635]|uniref:penicillin acylase family protein n=1 Tax=Colwellia sp. Arc7-635 TaxID=2497879 RepID=UPI000F855CD1|nr:penicillin acylase family protein [Colwellia sp. Arc7-635]AZQ85566.1 penicillin acylase family protein [Colwellia sp. Arc7-635]
MKYFKNTLLGLLFVLLLVLASLGTWIYSQIDSALPQLDGKRTLYGLSTSATVERDKQGIVTIKAKNRLDIAVATGFVHAQERFFQMDLLRRNSAGELASLFGEAAIDYDSEIRRHRFRERAMAIVAQLSSAELNLLKAYTRGVNQGLKYLKAPPFEYLLLRQEPVEWREEDTILTVLSMYIDLQYPDGERERTLGLLHSVLSPEVFAFLNPKGSIWDAAIDGTEFSESPLPKAPWPSASSENMAALFKARVLASPLSNTKPPVLAREQSAQSEEFPGSNNWAVSGQISRTGSAIVANDMHLGIRVPNTWFRASFEYNDADDSPVKVTGATLPGTPNIIIGSNGHIAWGFTNSYGDWSDVVVLETNADESQYLTPDGYQDFIERKQIIAVKDKEAVNITVTDTIWGPVIGKNAQGNLLVYHWIAHDKAAVNMAITEFETTTNVAQALAIAARAGMPAQNLMVGDQQGNIGWTIMGPIPQRSTTFGAIPTSWADGKHKWLGLLPPQDYPKVINPDNSRLWTANSRVVGGEMLEKVGNGGYALGARSSQIKQNLNAKASFDEQALLDVALDDRALFLLRWQEFLLSKVLTDEMLVKHSSWQEVKKIISVKNLAASTDSVAYRLVRNFRLNTRTQVFDIFNENMTNIDHSYSFNTIRHQIEAPLWQLVNQQPENFLWRSHDSWSALFEASLEATLAQMTESTTLAKATWGQENISTIQHPLSNAVPFIGRWLDMPAVALPGDSYMPRVQGKSFGASQRMVVSPGHEEHGIFHMPTSQSGHPWSPYYGLGHENWVNGTASSFLPGPSVYTLTLLNY